MPIAQGERCRRRDVRRNMQIAEGETLYSGMKRMGMLKAQGLKELIAQGGTCGSHKGETLYSGMKRLGMRIAQGADSTRSWDKERPCTLA